MANETLARRYATAVFSLASEKAAVERVGADLASVAEAMASDTATREFFIAPTVDRRMKEQTLTTALTGKLDTVALHTILLLVRKRRESLLPELLVEYRKLQAHARGAEPLTITTARDLPEAELRTMVARLEATYRTKFDVTVHQDPSLIGGVRIMMGDRRIDGTVSGRLEELARTLFANN